MKIISPFALGATMYMPVIEDSAMSCIIGEKYPNLKSMVLCLEDALHEKDVESGFQRLKGILIELLTTVKRSENAPLLFVRPRDIAMAREIVRLRGINEIDGIIAPKVRPGEIKEWISILNHTNLTLMPTLETVEAFDVDLMKKLCQEMLDHEPHRILASGLAATI